MSAMQSTLQTGEYGTPMGSTFEQLSSSYQLVLAAVAMVQNLRDEEDLQCLFFLAEEFGALRPNPFYFSIQRLDDQALPCSLVLRDAFASLLESGAIVLADARLAVRRFAQQARGVLVHPAFGAWLATLSPIERRALAAAVLELRANGATMRGRAAVAPFRQTLDRALGAEAAELLERRLKALRWQ